MDHQHSPRQPAAPQGKFPALSINVAASMAGPAASNRIGAWELPADHSLGLAGRNMDPTNIRLGLPSSVQPGLRLSVVCASLGGSEATSSAASSPLPSDGDRNDPLASSDSIYSTNSNNGADLVYGAFSSVAPQPASSSFHHGRNGGAPFVMYPSPTAAPFAGPPPTAVGPQGGEAVGANNHNHNRGSLSPQTGAMGEVVMSSNNTNMTTSTTLRQPNAAAATAAATTTTTTLLQRNGSFHSKASIDMSFSQQLGGSRGGGAGRGAAFRRGGIGSSCRSSGTESCGTGSAYGSSAMEDDDYADDDADWGGAEDEGTIHRDAAAHSRRVDSCAPNSGSDGRERSRRRPRSRASGRLSRGSFASRTSASHRGSSPRQPAFGVSHPQPQPISQQGFVTTSGWAPSLYPVQPRQSIPGGNDSINSVINTFFGSGRGLEHRYSQATLACISGPQQLVGVVGGSSSVNPSLQSNSANATSSVTNSSGQQMNSRSSQSHTTGVGGGAESPTFTPTGVTLLVHPRRNASFSRGGHPPHSHQQQQQASLTNYPSVVGTPSSVGYQQQQQQYHHATYAAAGLSMHTPMMGAGAVGGSFAGNVSFASGMGGDRTSTLGVSLGLGVGGRELLGGFVRVAATGATPHMQSSVRGPPSTDGGSPRGINGSSQPIPVNGKASLDGWRSTPSNSPTSGGMWSAGALLHQQQAHPFARRAGAEVVVSSTMAAHTAADGGAHHHCPNTLFTLPQDSPPLLANNTPRSNIITTSSGFGIMSAASPSEHGVRGGGGANNTSTSGRLGASVSTGNSASPSSNLQANVSLPPLQVAPMKGAHPQLMVQRRHTKGPMATLATVLTSVPPAGDITATAIAQLLPTGAAGGESASNNTSLRKQSGHLGSPAGHTPLQQHTALGSSINSAPVALVQPMGMPSPTIGHSNKRPTLAINISSRHSNLSLQSGGRGGSGSAVDHDDSQTNFTNESGFSYALQLANMAPANHHSPTFSGTNSSVNQRRGHPLGKGSGSGGSGVGPRGNALGAMPTHPHQGQAGVSVPALGPAQHPFQNRKVAHPAPAGSTPQLWTNGFVPSLTSNPEAANAVRAETSPLGAATDDKSGAKPTLHTSIAVNNMSLSHYSGVSPPQKPASIPQHLHGGLRGPFGLAGPVGRKPALLHINTEASAAVQSMGSEEFGAHQRAGGGRTSALAGRSHNLQQVHGANSNNNNSGSLPLNIGSLLMPPRDTPAARKRGPLQFGMPNTKDAFEDGTNPEASFPGTGPGPASGALPAFISTNKQGSTPMMHHSRHYSAYSPLADHGAAGDSSADYTASLTPHKHHQGGLPYHCPSGGAGYGLNINVYAANGPMSGTHAAGSSRMGGFPSSAGKMGLKLNLVSYGMDGSIASLGIGNNNMGPEGSGPVARMAAKMASSTTVHNSGMILSVTNASLGGSHKPGAGPCLRPKAESCRSRDDRTSFAGSRFGGDSSTNNSVRNYTKALKAKERSRAADGGRFHINEIIANELYLCAAKTLVVDPSVHKAYESRCKARRMARQRRRIQRMQGKMGVGGVVGETQMSDHHPAHGGGWMFMGAATANTTTVLARKRSNASLGTGPTSGDDTSALFNSYNKAPTSTSDDCESHQEDNNADGPTYANCRVCDDLQLTAFLCVADEIEELDIVRPHVHRCYEAYVRQLREELAATHGSGVSLSAPPPADVVDSVMAGFAAGVGSNSAGADTGESYSRAVVEVHGVGMSGAVATPPQTVLSIHGQHPAVQGVLETNSPSSGTGRSSGAGGAGGVGGFGDPNTVPSPTSIHHPSHGLIAAQQGVPPFVRATAAGSNSIIHSVPPTPHAADADHMDGAVAIHARFGHFVRLQTKAGGSRARSDSTSSLSTPLNTSGRNQPRIANFHPAETHQGIPAAKQLSGNDEASNEASQSVSFGRKGRSPAATPTQAVNTAIPTLNTAYAASPQIHIEWSQHVGFISQPHLRLTGNPEAVARSPTHWLSPSSNNSRGSSSTRGGSGFTPISRDGKGAGSVYRTLAKVSRVQQATATTRNAFSADGALYEPMDDENEEMRQLLVSSPEEVGENSDHDGSYHPGDDAEFGFSFSQERPAGASVSTHKGPAAIEDWSASNSPAMAFTVTHVASNTASRQLSPAAACQLQQPGGTPVGGLSRPPLLAPPSEPLGPSTHLTPKLLSAGAFQQLEVESSYQPSLAPSRRSRLTMASHTPCNTFTQDSAGTGGGPDAPKGFYGIRGTMTNNNRRNRTIAFAAEVGVDHSWSNKHNTTTSSTASGAAVLVKGCGALASAAATTTTATTSTHTPTASDLHLGYDSPMRSLLCPRPSRVGLEGDPLAVGGPTITSTVAVDVPLEALPVPLASPFNKSFTSGSGDKEALISKLHSPTGSTNPFGGMFGSLGSGPSASAAGVSAYGKTVAYASCTSPTKAAAATASTTTPQKVIHVRNESLADYPIVDAVDHPAPSAPDGDDCFGTPRISPTPNGGSAEAVTQAPTTVAPQQPAKGPPTAAPPVTVPVPASAVAPTRPTPPAAKAPPKNVIHLPVHTVISATIIIPLASPPIEREAATTAVGSGGSGDALLSPSHMGAPVAIPGMSPSHSSSQRQPHVFPQMMVPAAMEGKRKRVVSVTDNMHLHTAESTTNGTSIAGGSTLQPPLAPAGPNLALPPLRSVANGVAIAHPAAHRGNLFTPPHFAGGPTTTVQTDPSGGVPSELPSLIPGLLNNDQHSSALANPHLSLGVGGGGSGTSLTALTATEVVNRFGGITVLPLGIQASASNTPQDSLGQTGQGLGSLSANNSTTTMTTVPLIRICHLPLTDMCDSESFLRQQQEAYAFIERCRSEGRKVVIFCREAKSRSPSTTIAYLMRRYQWGFDKSRRHVSTRCATADPNIRFCIFLTKLEKVLEEERAKKRERKAQREETKAQRARQAVFGFQQQLAARPGGNVATSNILVATSKRSSENEDVALRHARFGGGVEVMQPSDAPLVTVFPEHCLPLHGTDLDTPLPGSFGVNPPQQARFRPTCGNASTATSSDMATPQSICAYVPAHNFEPVSSTRVFGNPTGGLSISANTVSAPNLSTNSSEPLPNVSALKGFTFDVHAHPVMARGLPFVSATARRNKGSSSEEIAIGGPSSPVTMSSPPPPPFPHPIAGGADAKLPAMYAGLGHPTSTPPTNQSTPHMRKCTMIASAPSLELGDMLQAGLPQAAGAGHPHPQLRHMALAHTAAPAHPSDPSEHHHHVTQLPAAVGDGRDPAELSQSAPHVVHFAAHHNPTLSSCTATPATMSAAGSTGGLGGSATEEDGVPQMVPPNIHLHVGRRPFLHPSLDQAGQQPGGGGDAPAAAAAAMGSPTAAPRHHDAHAEPSPSGSGWGVWRKQ